MVGGGSTYYLLACILTGAMTLVGLALLFTRAENIERTSLVSATTLIGCGIAIAILWNSHRAAADIADGVAWSAIALSIFGFVLGRVWDAILGPRDKVHHDPAVLGGDLAD
jgi:hypothetical protein